MSWNWSTKNVIVFSWWRTETVWELIASCLLILLLSLAYEGLAYWQRWRDQEALSLEAAYANIPLTGEHFGSLRHYQAPGRWSRSLLYGLRVFMMILMMLIMMTFNGFLIFSIVLGASVGHFMLGTGLGCH